MQFKVYIQDTLSGSSVPLKHMDGLRSRVICSFLFSYLDILLVELYLPRTLPSKNQILSYLHCFKRSWYWNDYCCHYEEVKPFCGVVYKDNHWVHLPCPKKRVHWTMLQKTHPNYMYNSYCKCVLYTVYF